MLECWPRLNALCCPSGFNGAKIQLGKEVGDLRDWNENTGNPQTT